MSAGFVVVRYVLDEAADGWSDTGAVVRRAGTHIADAGAGSWSPAVAGPVGSFVEAWGRDVETLAATADGVGSALARTRDTYTGVDDGVHELFRTTP